MAIKDSSDNWIYGNDASFTTIVAVSNPFALQTQSATNISDTTATLNGEITGLGGNSYAMVKFEYGKVGSATNTFLNKIKLKINNRFISFLGE